MMKQLFSIHVLSAKARYLVCRLVCRSRNRLTERFLTVGYGMNKRQIVLSIFIFLASLWVSSPVMANSTPMTIMFEAKIATQQGGKLQGKHNVKVIISGEVERAGVFKRETQWTDTLKDVEFYNGICSIVLGTEIGRAHV